MTGIQLIIPLLEGEDSSPHLGDMTNEDNLTGTEENENSNNNNGSHHGGGGEGVLTHELRESFEAMKAIWRQAGRDNEDSAANEELKRKMREHAIETALAVDSEVTKWQNGVAELEAMLSAAADEDGSEGDYNSEDVDEEDMRQGHHGVRPLPAVRFPSLPPVVVPDDEDIDETPPSSTRGSD